MSWILDALTIWALGACAVFPLMLALLYAGGRAEGDD
jgi:hypothetical protein